MSDRVMFSIGVLLAIGNALACPLMLYGAATAPDGTSALFYSLTAVFNGVMCFQTTLTLVDW
jgi:hypothetical protein